MSSIARSRPDSHLISFQMGSPVAKALFTIYPKYGDFPATVLQVVAFDGYVIAEVLVVVKEVTK